jgi:hypothetical protein
MVSSSLLILTVLTALGNTLPLDVRPGSDVEARVSYFVGLAIYFNPICNILTLVLSYRTLLLKV